MSSLRCTARQAGSSRLVRVGVRFAYLAEPGRGRDSNPGLMTGSGEAYMSDPGVVSNSPVSSQVFKPERIIGQPPYN